MSLQVVETQSGIYDLTNNTEVFSHPVVVTGLYRLRVRLSSRHPATGDYNFSLFVDSSAVEPNPYPFSSGSNADSTFFSREVLYLGSETCRLSILSPHSADSAVPVTTDLFALHTCSGAGSAAFTYAVKDCTTESPMSDVAVWVTTDAEGSNIVASGRTDSFGNVTFFLDPGNYYFWRKKSGQNFSNPDPETVT